MATRKRLPYVLRRQRADGTFAFRGFADTPGGRRVYTQSYDDEHDAYRAALGLRGEAGNPVAAQTLFDACETVLDELRLKRTKGSVRWYSDHFRAIQRLIPGETCISSITLDMLEQFIRDRLAGEGKRKVSPATVNADLRALHRVFAVAIRRGVVRENPVRHVERPRADEPAMDWFTSEEFAQALAKIDDQRTRDVLTLFALTGIRRSEAARLQPGHLRRNSRQLIVPGKTRTRTLPLSDDLADALLDRLQAAADSQALLPGGTHFIDDTFRTAKEQCRDRRMHPHALRHTFGTALVRNGVRLDVVMRLMGHRSIKTTMRYAHEVGVDGVQAVGTLRLVQPAASEQRAPG